MKVEVHLHTSRYSACAIVNPRQVMWKLFEVGYEVVFITEHDAVWTDRELAELRHAFPRLRVFPGIEISVGADLSEHLLVLGTNDPAYLSLPTPAEIIERARGEGLLTVLAHPFRWTRSPDVLAGAVLPDAIEYLTPNHGSEPAELSEAAARSLGLALVNAGDVHALQSIDRFWIDTDRPVERPGDLREIVLERAYVNRGGVGLHSTRSW